MRAFRCLWILPCLMLLAERPAADDLAPDVLSLPAVGDTLDALERERYGVLTEYLGFQRAQFHMEPDSQVSAAVVVLVNGAERAVTLPRYRHVLALQSWFQRDPARIERSKSKTGSYVTTRFASGGAWDGELIAVRDTAVVVAVTPRSRQRFGSEAPEQVRIFRNQEISEVVVYRDGHTWQRIGVGTVIGVAIGALVGAASGDSESGGWFEMTGKEKIGFLAYVGGATGFMYGGLKALFSSWDWNVDPRDRESMGFVREKARYPGSEPAYLDGFR